MNLREAFLQDFADALNGADKVYLCDIFGSAREKQGGLTIHDLIACCIKVPGLGCNPSNNTVVKDPHMDFPVSMSE